MTTVLSLIFEVADSSTIRNPRECPFSIAISGRADFEHAALKQAISMKYPP